MPLGDTTTRQQRTRAADAPATRRIGGEVHHDQDLSSSTIAIASDDQLMPKLRMTKAYRRLSGQRKKLVVARRFERAAYAVVVCEIATDAASASGTPGNMVAGMLLRCGGVRPGARPR